MAGQPKPTFYFALLLVVFGLIVFGLYRAGMFGGKEPVAAGGGQVKDGGGGNAGGNQAGGTAGQNTTGDAAGGAGTTAATASEAAGSPGITTVKEYTQLAPASERFPKPKGTSAYKPLAETDNTVRFALNVWAGWGPIILANDGFKAGKIWKTPDGVEFKLELVLIDKPVAMRDSYAAGDVHIGWGTLDMVPLFMEGFIGDNGEPLDARVMPRIFQQVDWSNGGDGIVVRQNIKTMADLSGKRLALARNSPSHYFALTMLRAAGLRPTDLEVNYYEDAFQAAAAFNTERDIAGAVSWAPDIYSLAEAQGNKMLVTTGTANKLIADIWFARADFASDNPGIIEALVRGIFEGMEMLEVPANKEKCAELMADGYGFPATETIKMFADAHSTNWAENFQFFMNQNNPANFERVWAQAYFLYRQVGSIAHRPVPFDRVMDFTYIEKLGKEEKYSSQRDTYRMQFAPEPAATTLAESDEIVAKTVVIHFYPNSWDLAKMITKEVGGKTVEELYDPHIDFVLEEIAKLAAQFGAARIVIEGHTDASMKGQVPATLVRELSQNRANAVKEAIVNKFMLNPNQFSVSGVGWDEPADPSDPDNHAKNRRVEIRVFSAEKAS